MDKSNGLLTYGISDQKLNEGRTKGEMRKRRFVRKVVHGYMTMI